ncbi:MAG: metallophosphoesterase [Myxococcota bacterium]
MKILHVHEEPLHTFQCFNLAPGGRKVEERQIPVLQIVVDDLGDPGLDALVITSDLQGFDAYDCPVSERRLLGHIVAEGMPRLVPDPSRVGVVLAGDFFALPALNRRGGLGDVQAIWSAFAHHFRWVVGVAGNHDSFKGRTDFVGVFEGEPSIYPLHGTAVHLDGLWIGGISGIHGAPIRAWRHNNRDLQRMLRSVLAARPELLVLHEGPDRPDKPGAGRRALRDTLNKAHVEALVICGHRHWEHPVASLEAGTQVLNVDSRVVVLTRDGFTLGG